MIISDVKGKTWLSILKAFMEVILWQTFLISCFITKT